MMPTMDAISYASVEGTSGAKAWHRKHGLELCSYMPRTLEPEVARRIQAGEVWAGYLPVSRGLGGGLLRWEIRHRPEGYVAHIDYWSAEELRFQAMMNPQFQKFIYDA